MGRLGSWREDGAAGGQLEGGQAPSWSMKPVVWSPWSVEPCEPRAGSGGRGGGVGV